MPVQYDINAIALLRRHYCCVALCHSSSGERVERTLRNAKAVVSFLNNTERKMWVLKIRRNLGADFKVNKNMKVSTLHFTAEMITLLEKQSIMF